MISRKEVEHIAKLARIALSPEEVEKMQKDLSQVLDYFELLSRADVSGIEASTLSSDYKNIWREDKVNEQSPEVVRALVEMSPRSKKGYIKVKSILDDF